MSFAANSIASAASGARITNTALIDDGYGLTIGRSAGSVILRGDLSSSDMDISPDRAMPGETVTYTVRMRNTGGADTAGSLTCTLPAPLIHRSEQRVCLLRRSCALLVIRLPGKAKSSVKEW